MPRKNSKVGNPKGFKQESMSSKSQEIPLMTEAERKKMVDKTESRETRARHWEIVCYPDSVPTKWQEIISAEKTPWVESPLHDRDINPDGTTKKPHWHIYLLFDAPKARKQIMEIASKISTKAIDKIRNIKGAVPYMVHFHNPEKAQYDRVGIKYHNGANEDELWPLTATEKREMRYLMIMEMQDFVDENNISSISTLMRFSRTNNRDWFMALCDNSAYVMSEYIKSAHWERQNEIHNENRQENNRKIFSEQLNTIRLSKMGQAVECDTPFEVE